MAAKSRGLGSNRVLGKLKLSIENGDYYEAHQMYRTLYFRYINQNKYSDVLTLMYEGATLLLEHKQNNSGTDLAILLVEALTKSELLVNEMYIGQLSKLFEKMLQNSPERVTFLSTALNWSSKEHSRGHPLLHQHIAQILWKEKNYTQARYHFIHSQDGGSCATMLIEYHISQGYPSEIDLFIAQAVFQYLCLKNKATASLVFFTYIENHPEVRTGPPFLLPLLNFLWFLLLAIEQGKLPVFTVICEHYQPSINRDPAYHQYLDRIGQIFFGLPPPPTKNQGIIGNLISSLCGVFEEDEPYTGPSSSNLTAQIEDLD